MGASATFNRRSTAEQVSEGIDLTGKNYIVTGANTGIGKETARVLALRGAQVIMACRDVNKAQLAKKEILARHPQIDAALLEVFELDLSRQASVRAFAEQYNALQRPLHCLINNAGVMAQHLRYTDDGFEVQFGTNHLGHFLLSNLLRPSLRAAGSSRIVVVSSSAMIFAKLTPEFLDLDWRERPYKAMDAYSDSKLMNAMTAVEMQQRFAADGIAVNYLHPGIIKTELGRDATLTFRLMALLMLPATKSIPRGAATTVLVATAEKYGQQGGFYLGDCSEWEPTKPIIKDDYARKKLWQLSAQLTGL